MKRILLRSKTTPLDIFDPVTFIEYDKSGTNLGNLLYQHAVYKHLSHETQNITINNNSVNLKRVDYINNNYDHFVVPLANAFRPSYEKNLKKLTEFIKMLDIPVTIVGVGAQTDSEFNFDNLNKINSTVKEFLSVVFDKGSSIGVRGEGTKAYIEELGFYNKAEVIGCPSLFTFPENIRNMDKKDVLPTNAKLALNLSVTGPQAAFSNHLNNFEKIFKHNYYFYDDVYYIPQETRSLELLTYGVAKRKGIEHGMLDPRLSKILFTEDKIKFFLNSYSWFEFFKSRDFTFGTRLHGCIASLVAGTPAMLFAHDSRTLEIARHFKLPYLELNRINEVLDASEIYNNIDLSPMKTIYQENLSKYSSFLRSNGLETIVDNDENMKIFDEKISDEHRQLIVTPLQMNQKSIGERLHWLKQNYDFKLSKRQNV
ncbi:MAG: polysaccharide pyruvyl transferase family protein [Moraxellaceae bacterium]|nr:MAG: polysaccharide pyruvyl transferase family protein [Moraxellaceae bacterium]